MAAYDKIRASDYNTIRNVVLPVWSAGAGTSGYGFTMASAQKSNHEKITSLDWDKLRWDIINTRLHQDGSIPTPNPVDVAAYEKIKYTQHVTDYTTETNNILTNRFNNATGRFSTSTVRTATYVSTWLNSISCEFTATFSSADQARYFFNSGGQFRITTSRTGGTAKSQNTAWTSLLDSAGQQNFGSQTPTTGFSPLNGQNFYRLTNVYQNYYSLASSAPYAANTYVLQAKSNVADNSGGTATIVYLKVILTDGYVDPGNNPTDVPNTTEGVDGTVTITVVEKKAAGALEPSGSAGTYYGGVTDVSGFITSATTTISSITGS